MKSSWLLFCFKNTSHQIYLLYLKRQESRDQNSAWWYSIITRLQWNLWAYIIQYRVCNNHQWESSYWGWLWYLAWQETARKKSVAVSDWLVMTKSVCNTLSARSINLARFTFLDPGSLFLRNQSYWIHEEPSKSVQVSSCGTLSRCTKLENCWYICIISSPRTTGIGCTTYLSATKERGFLVSNFLAPFLFG